MDRIGDSQSSDVGSSPTSSAVPSSKRNRIPPFQGGDASSILVGTTVAVAEWLNAAECDSAEEKSSTEGSNPSDHLWQRRASGLSRYAANVLFVGSNPSVAFEYI